MALANSILIAGTRAAQPAAAAENNGVYYRVTDEGNIVEQSTGAAWVAIAASSAGANLITTPQGRVTLTTGVPFMVTTATAQTTVYYTPAVGNVVPIYNGTTWTNTTFTQLSQATTDNTKSPAAVANNSNYDVFVWSDGGTLRATRGPAWTSDTGRGTGAGTTELEYVNGILMNKIAITNGPGAQRGTYVGTIRSNGSAQIDMIFGGAGAAGGEDTVMGLWNMYQRQACALVNFDNTNSWNYTTATYRVKDGDSSNRISFVVGWQGDGFSANNLASSSNTNTGQTMEVAIGLNSETVPATGSGTSRAITSTANATYGHSAQYTAVAPLGFNYIAPLEISSAAGTTTWIGDNGGTQFYSIFNALMRF